MSEFLDQIVAFPTVIYTTLLGLVLLYWGFVILGILDVDVLDGAEGVAEGLAEGAAEAAAEGAAEAGLGLAGLVHALKLRNAPVTVVLSLTVLSSWVLSFLAMVHVAPHIGFIPTLVVQGLVFALSPVLALPVTSLLVWPLGPLFRTHQGGRLQSFVGEVCEITTGKVTEGFGQATLSDGGAGLLVQVRCLRANELKKGSQALVVNYDPERQTFLVEPVEPGQLEAQSPSAQHARATLPERE